MASYVYGQYYAPVCIPGQAEVGIGGDLQN